MKLQCSKMVLLITCMMPLLVGIVGVNSFASEVYTWTDENGVIHFGDMPPKGRKSQEVELRETDRPGGTTGADQVSSGEQADTTSDAAEQSAAIGPEADPPLTAAQARREKIATDRKEQRERRAQMEQNCVTQQERLEKVEHSTRVIYRDDSGELVRMSNEDRVSQVEELQAYITKNCG